MNARMPTDLSVDQVDELLAYLDLSDDDFERIRSLTELLEGASGEVADAFYDHVEKFPSVAASLEGHRERLRRVQATYFDQLVHGEVDLDYVGSRQRVGRTHARLGLDLWAYVGAFSKYATTVGGLVKSDARTKAQMSDHWEALASLNKLIFFDMSVSNQAYLDATLERLATKEEQVRDAEAVRDVVDAVAGCRDTKDAIRAALSAVRASFGWSYASFWAYDPESDALRFDVSDGEVDEEFDAVSARVSFSHGVGVAGRAWKKQDLVFVEDLGQVHDCPRAPVARSAGIRSGVCLPIVVQDKVVGTMDFFITDRRPLSEGRRGALRNVASVLSSVIEQQRGMEAARDAAAVGQVLKVLSEAKDPDEALRESLHVVRRAFGWTVGGLWSLPEWMDLSSGPARIQRIEASGEAHPAFERACRDAVVQPTEHDGTIGAAWTHRRLQTVHDLAQRQGDVRVAAAREAGLRGGVCLPILDGDAVLAVMDFWGPELSTPTEERRLVLTDVANLVASTVQQLREREMFARALQEFGVELRETSVDIRDTMGEQSVATQGLAAAITEVTTTLEELRAASGDALEKAELVIEQAERSVAVSSAGSAAVGEAALSMREIQQQVGEIADRILTLNEQTSQIGDIIASVSEIAAQSKMLALNASIEAARAGEHGRGFAVVATEIRSLSDQSKDATSQVRQILGEIQGGTNSAVVAAEEGTKRAQSGVELAERSGSDIRDLASSLESSRESANRIVNNARQQNIAIEQVSEAMGSISDATQSTADGMKNTERSVTRLVDLGRRIAELTEAYS